MGCENIFEVFVDRWDRDIEEFGDEFLGEPDGFVLETHLKLIFSGLAGENEELGGGIADVHEELGLILRFNRERTRIYAKLIIPWSEALFLKEIIFHALSFVNVIFCD